MGESSRIPAFTMEMMVPTSSASMITSGRMPNRFSASSTSARVPHDLGGRARGRRQNCSRVGCFFAFSDGAEKAVQRGLAIKLAPGQPGLCCCGAGCSIDEDTFHRRQIDHKSAVKHGEPRSIVSSATSGRVNVLVGAESNGCLDIGWPSAACNRSGLRDSIIAFQITRDASYSAEPGVSIRPRNVGVRGLDIHVVSGLGHPITTDRGIAWC